MNIPVLHNCGPLLKINCLLHANAVDIINFSLHSANTTYQITPISKLYRARRCLDIIISTISD